MKYILVQVTGQQGIQVMERQSIGDHDVYVHYATARDTEGAALIRDALNAAQ